MSPHEQLKQDVIALCLEHGRRVGTEGHEAALRYLNQRMEAIGLDPFEGTSFQLPYRGTDLSTGHSNTFTNLAGVVPGTGSTMPPLLIGAHYDSVIDAPCADDNAAAVAVVLGVAEAVKRSPLSRDLIVCIFDAEEPPYFLTPEMGSNRFYQDHVDGTPFGAALILDLIAHDVTFGGLETKHPELRDLLFVLGAESHVALPSVIDGAASDVPELQVVAARNDLIGDMSDHAAFRKGGEAFLFLSCGQGRCYHRPCDNLDEPDWFSFRKMNLVYDYSFAALRHMDGGSGLHSLRGGCQPHDPDDYEIGRLLQVFGSCLDDLGIGAVKDARDVAALVQKLKALL
jgi:hypothetical protein